MGERTEHGATAGRVDPGAARGSDATLLYDLRAAFARPGCAICRLVDRDVRRHIFAVIYDLVMESAIWNKLRQSHGFCHDHTWLAVQMEQQRQGDGRGIALVLEDVLSTVQAQIDQGNAADAQSWGAQLVRRATGWHTVPSRSDAALVAALTHPEPTTPVRAARHLQIIAEHDQIDAALEEADARGDVAAARDIVLAALRNGAYILV
jgi:hypothetical protein